MKEIHFRKKKREKEIRKEDGKEKFRRKDHNEKIYDEERVGMGIKKKG